MEYSALTVDHLGWLRLADDLAGGRASLLGLWADGAVVHLCLLAQGKVRLVRLATEDGRYSSIGRRHAPALRFERMIADLHGLTAQGSPDDRPWLRHDGSYPFLPVEGPGLHQIAVGPIHAGIIEPGHFRFTVNGETIVRLEARLGYLHRGVEALLQGAAIADGARVLARLSGDSTVAYSFAYALAVEAALGVTPPPRASILRGVMAELERLANHFNDIGFICNDAALGALHAAFALLREECLRLSQRLFGHRLLMDRIVPGGVAADLDPEGAIRLAAWLDAAGRRFDGLIEIYDENASIKDRTLHTGLLTPELAARFAAGGFVGRASGRDFDCRRDLAYAPYDQLAVEVPVLNRGDVNARLWLRRCEVKVSLTLIATLLDLLADGDIMAPLPDHPGAGEGLALVEGFRGDVLVWLRLAEDGSIARCHPRDPSWQQWPLLEAAIAGNIVADFPLCNKSFNCSYAGVDL